MTSEAQFWINLAVGLFGILIGWIVTAQKDAMKSLKESDAIIMGKLTEMEILVAGQYVKHVDLQRISDNAKQDLQRVENTLLGALQKIDQKLDGKADKDQAHYPR